MRNEEARILVINRQFERDEEQANSLDEVVKELKREGFKVTEQPDLFMLHAVYERYDLVIAHPPGQAIGVLLDNHKQSRDIPLILCSYRVGSGGVEPSDGFARDADGVYHDSNATTEQYMNFVRKLTAGMK